MFVASMRWRAPALRRLAVLAVALVVASTITIAPTPAHADDTTVDVTAWAPYWKAQEALPSFQAQSGMFNELTPFFFSAVSANDIVFNPNMSSPTTRLEEYRAAAQAKGKPFIATIVDAMPARQMAGVLATPEGRTAHVQALVAFMVGNGFDGIDLDYEQFAFSDGRVTWDDTFGNWGAFLVELAAAVHAVPGKVLATSVPPIYNANHDDDSGYWVYNFPTMAQVVDRVRVMTYSYSVSSPGPIAPYSWVSSSIDAIAKIVPASKLYMGVPAYGTDWITNIAGTCPVTVKPDQLRKRSPATDEFAQYAANRGAVPKWNATYQEMTFSYVESFEGPDANNIFVRCNVSRTAWYVDSYAIYQRALLAQHKQLAGIAMWALGYDDLATWDGLAHARAHDATWHAPPPLPPKAIPAPGPPITSSGPLPARFLDTREGFKTADKLFAGIGKQQANTVLEVQIAGRGAVPGGTAAVSLNVTVLGEATGYVTVYPCGERPLASSLNVKAGQTISNSVITRLSASGSVCIYTQVPANVVVDVFGILPNTAFTPVATPARLLDTRRGETTVDGQSAGAGALKAQGVIEVPVAARGGMGDAAKTAVLNVTAVNAIGNGYLTVWPCDSPRPSTSNVNYTTGGTIPNAVVTALSADGSVCVYSSNGTDVVIDAFGELDTDNFHALPQAARLLDTRSGNSTVDGVANATGKMEAGQVYELAVGGRGGLPANPTAVILNVTVDAPELAGFVTVYPCGTARPLVSNVNFSPLQTLPNLVVTKLSPQGTVCVFSLVRTHVVVDVFGSLTL